MTPMLENIFTEITERGWLIYSLHESTAYHTGHYPFRYSVILRKENPSGLGLIGMAEGNDLYLTLTAALEAAENDAKPHEIPKANYTVEKPNLSALLDRIRKPSEPINRRI